MKGTIHLDEQEYFKERLDNQIQWYSRKSASCQSRYKRMKGIICLASVSIAPISLLDFADGKYIVCCLGSIIAVITFFLSMNKYHENWIQYRATCESLRHEKYLYLTRSGEYAQVNAPFHVLVDRCESIISRENIDWAQLQRKEASVPVVNQSSTNS